VGIAVRKKKKPLKILRREVIKLSLQDILTQPPSLYFISFLHPSVTVHPHPRRQKGKINFAERERERELRGSF
jgi:hypothetical protein